MESKLTQVCNQVGFCVAFLRHPPLSYHIHEPTPHAVLAVASRRRPTGVVTRAMAALFTPTPSRRGASSVRSGCPRETFRRPTERGLLAIQIDGIHMDEDMLLVAAIGVDANGDKHPLGLVEGATENAATVQALIDNLVERGLDPTVRRLFIIDSAKALSKAIRRTFGRDTASQRCQIHYAELRIMPTSAAKPAWGRVIAVKEAA